MGALGRGHDALIAFAPAETPVLWPEHFDVAIRVQERTSGCRRATASSRSRTRTWASSRPPAGDAFWNAPFGAAVPLTELPDAAAVTAFFAEGRTRGT